MIGAFPTSESAAEPEYMREALFWLDMILAERAGTTRIFRLIPGTVSLTLEAGKQVYTLKDDLGAAMPSNGIQFPVEAWLENASGHRSDLEIVTRYAFETVSDIASTGIPSKIYLDRLDSMTLSTYPSLPSTETETYTVKLVVQTFAPDVSPSGVSGTQPNGSLSPEFSQAWQRWMTFALAADIGSGPVLPISTQRVAEFRKVAEKALGALEAYENREHETTPPICEPYGA
ncbi:hypothetical protein QMT40_001785 [Parvibaculaceae bacterium PLY_AMNH_Bact1]|nr:hypothetical protein QMT40_001785 [Parvibaculaceae bacterium PLY_AMNH_Bact1]